MRGDPSEENMEVNGRVGFLAPLAALLVLGCGTGRDDGRAQRMTEPYPHQVERMDIVGYTMLPKPELFLPEDAEAVVYARYRAPVERVRVAKGQRVNRGETIIELSFPSAEVASEQAEMQIREAESAMQQARSQHEATISQYEMALEQARQNERRLRETTDPDGDATALVEARRQREEAERSLQMARSQRDAALEPYRSQLEAARQHRESARQGLRQANIGSPIAGVVTEINVRPGQTVGDDTRQVLARIVNLDAQRIRADMSAGEMGIIEQGKEVTVAFRELPNKLFRGRVADVEALPAQDGRDTGNVRRVVLTFSNDQNQVQPGFTIDWAGVKVGEAKNVLAVPAEAVVNDDTGRPTVQVLEGGNWRVRVVELGMSDGRFIEVRSGIQEGETVQVVPGRRN
jgi:HlyD family secretion protein